MQMIFKVTEIKNGARREFTIEAYDYAEAEVLYYDTVTSEHDELISIDPA